MNLYPTAFTQTTFSSASLAGLCCIAHPVARAGAYTAQVWRGDRVVASVQLLVTESGGEAQANLDCSSLERAGRGLASIAAVGRLALRVRGSLVVNAQQGDGYRVVLHHGAGNAVEWDSRRLQPGDVFSVVVLRPGAYAVNSGNATATFRALYPDPRRNKGKAPRFQPLGIGLTANGFHPREWEVHPGQGMVFRMDTQSELSIRLTEPDDGPQDLAEWRKNEKERLLELLRNRCRR